MASIGFDNFRVSCVIGVEPHERISTQDIFVDLKVEVDISKAVVSDALQDALDYVQLASICAEIAVKGQYFLIEKYAEEVLKKIFLVPDVSAAWIKVKKPAALQGADYAYVELRKLKSEIL